MRRYVRSKLSMIVELYKAISAECKKLSPDAVMYRNNVPQGFRLPCFLVQVADTQAQRKLFDSFLFCKYIVLFYIKILHKPITYVIIIALYVYSSMHTNTHTIGVLFFFQRWTCKIMIIVEDIKEGGILKWQ